MKWKLSVPELRRVVGVLSAHPEVADLHSRAADLLTYHSTRLVAQKAQLAATKARAASLFRATFQRACRKGV